MSFEVSDDDIEGFYQPVAISVPVEELRRLCVLAQEAGEDLQAVACAEYPGDHPSMVRRRNRDLAYAQIIIDAARAMHGYIDPA